MTHMDHTRVGLIGVGNMGKRMARQMLDHGLDLIGYDADIAKVLDAGVPAAESISDLLARTDIILLSLPDSRVIEAVSYGDEGIIAHVRAGQIIVDLSTARASSTKALYEEYQKRGAELVDAGITGGVKGVENGTSTIMVGGSEVALEAVRGVLQTFSKFIYYMGKSGSGHAAKILNNFLACLTMSATGEVMVAAKKFGLNLETLLDVINHGSGINFNSLNRYPYVVRGDYLEGGLTNKLTAKDVSLYIDLTKELGVVSLQGPSCLNSYEIAIGLGYGDVINTRIVDALGDLSGGVRVSEKD